MSILSSLLSARRLTVPPRVQGAGAEECKPGAEGVKHTVAWYRTSGTESAHAEWHAHLKDLLHMESSGARSKPFWFE